jgi:hypothetical protein
MGGLLKSPKPKKLPPPPREPSKEEIRKKQLQFRRPVYQTVKTTPLGLVEYAINSVKKKLGE